jgi:hypothetical protein
MGFAKQEYEYKNMAKKKGIENIWLNLLLIKEPNLPYSLHNLDLYILPLLKFHTRYLESRALFLLVLKIKMLIHLYMVEEV